MGLDMYLTAERYLWDIKEKDKVLKAELSAVVPDAPGPINTIIVEAGYWRKANHIHNWFVHNVQKGVDECQKFMVSREQLTALRDLCEAVIESPEYADNVLRTTNGFFFGSTDYDECYLQDTKDTVDIVNKCLAADWNQWDFYYQSSW